MNPSERGLKGIVAMGLGDDRIPQLDPNEWDFRGLDPEHFYAALGYELARELPHIHEALALLTPERRSEIVALTEDGWEEWRPDWVPEKRFWQFWDAFRACWCCREFPKPWMALSDTIRAGAAFKCGKPPSPIRILARREFSRTELLEQSFSKVMESLGQNSISEEARIPIRRHIIEIDWSHDDPVLKPLLLGLLKLRPQGTRPRKRHTGKRATRPMHKFKELAAWRLAKKANLRYKEVQQLVDQRRKDCPQIDRFDLLPSYKSAGAWKGAVDAGQSLIRRRS